jgi:hypothetical protein
MLPAQLSLERVLLNVRERPRTQYGVAQWAS